MTDDAGIYGLTWAEAGRSGAQDRADPMYIPRLVDAPVLAASVQGAAFTR
jgi:hypothetical protein